MPMTYTIDREARLVRIVGQGLLTDGEMLACVTALRQDPDLEPDMNTLSDMRNIEVGFTADGITTMVDTMRLTASRRSSAKGAIVTNSDVAYGMGRAFGTRSELAEQRPEFRIFRDMTEALEWLGVE